MIGVVFAKPFFYQITGKPNVKFISRMREKNIEGPHNKEAPGKGAFDLVGVDGIEPPTLCL